MPHAKKTPTKASKQLARLRKKYSDRFVQSHKHVARLNDDFSPTNTTFQKTEELLTPAGSRSIFGSLYSFVFFLLTLLLLWIGYRAFIRQPIWFDEGVAKAVVFGLPVFWFAARSRFMAREIGLNKEQLWPGLFLGLAVGGLYGFVGLLSEVARGLVIVRAPLFVSGEFWWMAFLAFLTAWWESLFFYGLPIQYVRSLAPWFSETVLGIGVVVFFLLFHAPLRLLVTGVTPQFLVQMGVLALFAIGQFIFYMKTKNMYALVLSHALWGLVIQVYSR